MVGTRTIEVPKAAVQPLDAGGEGSEGGEGGEIGGSAETETLYYVSKDTVTAKGLLTVGSIDPTLLDGDFYIVYDLESGSIVFFECK